MSNEYKSTSMVELIELTRNRLNVLETQIKNKQAELFIKFLDDYTETKKALVALEEYREIIKKREQVHAVWQEFENICNPSNE